MCVGLILALATGSKLYLEPQLKLINAIAFYSYLASLIHPPRRFGPDEYAERDQIQMILEGKLSLSDIRYVPHSFKGDDDDDKVYDEIYADFCVYDMTLHKQDPSAYPAIRDVMGESRHCSEHRYSFPLREVIGAVHEYDARPDTTVRSVPVTGILLHEGRSGATLISNALAVAHPESTQVISEHPAILEALQACDTIRNKHLSEDCDANKQQRLLKDIVLLLSRTADASITNLYLKMQSAASPYLHQLRTAFPEAKWAFFYRDADVALAKATQRKRNACIKQRRSPSSAMLAYSTANGVDLEAASNHEICAMHLSTLINTAFEEHSSSGTGLLVSYDDDIIQSGGMPILDSILPYLGVDDANKDNNVKSRIVNVLTLNANARGRSDEGKKWNPQDDLTDVNDEVKAASSKYLKDDTLKIQRMRA